MNEEAKLKKQVEELKGKLLELAAIANNTVIEGLYKGDSVLRAATLMDICHRISDELNPKPEVEAKEERDKVSDAETTEVPPKDSKASNE